MDRDSVKDGLIYKEIGRRIQQARKAAGLTQDDLGSTIGVSSQHVSNVERGQSKLSVPRLSQISCALNVSLDYILGNCAYKDKAVENVNEEIAELLKDATEEERALYLRLCIAVKPRLENG